MTREVRRGIARIASNYARLASTLAIGIIEVPILLAWLGRDAFGLIGLLGPTIGLGAIVQDVLTRSMIRELGEAWHKRDDEEFARIYNACWVYALIAFAVSVALFTAVILALVPVLKISDELRTPAIVMATASAAFSCLSVLVTPTFNMYAVQERFAWQNFWLLARRLSHLLAAVILFFGVRLQDPGLSVIAYALLAQGLNILQLTASVLVQWIPDRRMRPRPLRADRASLREIASTFGWNSGVIATTNLADNLPLIFVNLYFGLAGNAVYGLARRLAAYARMICVGMTWGLDAVSARVSSSKEDGAFTRLLRHATRLNAFVALPAGLAIFTLADPLLHLWVARATSDQTLIDDAIAITQIFVISTTVRGISEGWQRMLYGAGHVRRFAPLYIGANLLMPPLLWLAMETVPDATRFHTPAGAYALLAIAVNLILLPALGARILGTGIGAYLRPILRPFLATLIASPVLIAGEVLLDGRWTLLRLVLVAGLFALVYATATWFVILEHDERHRLRGFLRPIKPGRTSDRTPS